MRREWNDREVEQLLRRAVDRSVPDVFEQVSSEEVPPLLDEYGGHHLDWRRAGDRDGSQPVSAGPPGGRNSG